MLALSRKPSERIRITDSAGVQFTLTVVELKGGRVRLSFDAPRSIGILRDEIADDERPRDVLTAA